MQNKRIVVKVGTSTLSHPSGLLNIRRVDLCSLLINPLQNAIQASEKVPEGERQISCSIWQENSMVFEDALHAIETAGAAGFRITAVYDETMAKKWPQICALTERQIRSYRELLS